MDASTNRALLSKSYNEAYEILEMIATNNYQWPSTKQATVRGAARVHNVDASTIWVISLTNMVKAITTAPTIVNQIAEVSCAYCGEGRLFDNCSGNLTLFNYVRNYNKQNENNPYPNTKYSSTAVWTLQNLL